MKCFALSVAVILGFFISSIAQQRTFTFEKVVNLRASIPNEELKAFVPPSRTTKHELLVADSVTLYRNIIDNTAEGFDQNDGGGRVRQFRIGGGADDEIFYNTQSKVRVRATEFFGDPYIITDTVGLTKWKLLDDTKVILNHTCKKALLIVSGKNISTVATQFRINRSAKDSSKSFGKADSSAFSDTVVAWYATDFLVSGGPEVFAGLPGVILELSMAKGTTHITAVEEKNEVAVKKIKAPTKGKKLTNAEYTAEVQKKLEDLRERGGGGGRPMRVNL